MKTIITCNNCEWFVTNPRTGEKSLNKNRPVIDDVCPNCRKTYEETNSKIEKNE